MGWGDVVGEWSCVVLVFFFSMCMCLWWMN